MNPESAGLALLFALLCTALFATPFVPAWAEWRRPTDAQPLAVPDDDDQDPLFLPERFRAQMERLRPIGPEAGYQPADEVDLLDPDDEAERARLPILASDSIRTVGAVTSTRPLYATADLDFRGGAMFAEVMAEGRLELGPRSRVAGWAHADRSVRLGEHSAAARRVTSREAVRLERGCCFEQVHAPTVRFGQDCVPRAHTAAGLQQGDLSSLPGAQPRTPGLWRIEGDCELPAGHRFQGSLVVTGVLSLGSGTVVEGSVKAHKGVLVGSGAQVTGAVVCDNGIHVMRDAEIGGPLVSETHLLLSSGVRLGRAEVPTTVSAEAIIAEEGAIAHGSVWARRAGVVWGTGA